MLGGDRLSHCEKQAPMDIVVPGYEWERSPPILTQALGLTKGDKVMIVRSCHQPSEPGGNRTGDRRKGNEDTTTNRSSKDIIYIR
jgi:hypothetical protein